MMNDFLEYISTWSVLKWIEAIAAKIRARRGNKEPVPEVSREPFASTPPAISSTNAPPDKKLLKAMAKAKKKEAKKKS